MIGTGASTVLPALADCDASAQLHKSPKVTACHMNLPYVQQL